MHFNFAHCVTISLHPLDVTMEHDFTDLSHSASVTISLHYGAAIPKVFGFHPKQSFKL